MAAVSSLVKLTFMRHRFKILNKDVLLDIIENKPAYKPLITVSNHHSCLDDLLLFGMALPYKYLLDVDKLKWTLAAVDICFLNKISCLFFTSGKGVPVWRRVRDPVTGEVILPGLGVFQNSMDFCLELLNAGRWVHVFSQGRIILPHERAQESKVRLRWGIGRLLAEASVNPTVLPIWHCGFDDLNPCEPPYARNALNRLFGPPRCVTVSVGTPFEVGGILRRTNDTGGALYSRLTTVVQRALYRLKAVAEAEHAKHLTFVKQ
ncbi:unnamed protein product [Mesocestoides corti]|uniref:Tafazzin family protein n=1 Tax=Mesocestoides corti TaxID=53468 RepID=A0A3P6H754_MESCO|nr:unnamed protein product [Mesocestoides corti]